MIKADAVHPFNPLPGTPLGTSGFQAAQAQGRLTCAQARESGRSPPPLRQRSELDGARSPASPSLSLGFSRPIPFHSADPCSGRDQGPRSGGGSRVRPSCAETTARTITITEGGG